MLQKNIQGADKMSEKIKLSEKKLARIKMDTKTETYGDDLVCPWCSEVDINSWELDDDGGEVDCNSCGKTFIYSVNRSISYSGHLPDEELDRLIGEIK